MRKFVLTLVALVSLATTAQAQSATDTLAEAMRQSIALCGDNTSQPAYALNKVYINDHCTKVQFQALQSYVDAASRCIAMPAAPGVCQEAKIIEQSLIKTFSLPSKTTKK